MDNYNNFDDLLSNDLNKFFLRDIYVTLTCYKLTTSLAAVVIDYSNNILSIRFKSSDLTKNLLVGDPIVISLCHENILYNASASILTVYTSTMDLKIEKVVTKNESRSNKRFLVGFSGELTHDDNTSFIIVKNISLTGLKILSKVNLPLNSEIDISINTYDFVKITFRAKIIHKTTLIDAYYYGVEITNIDDTNAKKLNVCISSLE